MSKATSPDAVDGVNYDVAAVNSDLAAAQEITKDDVNSATVYIDGAAIEELVLGAPTIRKAVENLEELLGVNDALSPEALAVFDQLDIDVENEEELEALQEALENASCTENTASWRKFDWLLGTPAYADDTRCSFVYKDEIVWVPTAQSLVECGLATIALLAVHYNRNLNQSRADDINVDMSGFEELSEDEQERRLAKAFGDIFGFELDPDDIRIYTPEEAQLHNAPPNTKIGIGSWEYVIGPDGSFVGDPVYIGTYNFVEYQDTVGTWAGHAAIDVVPWLLWGNVPNDPSSIGQRMGMLLGNPYRTPEEIYQQRQNSAQQWYDWNQENTARMEEYWGG